MEVLPLLERFEKIFLWMDDDQPGREGAEKFAQKLGIRRTFLVRPLPQVRRKGSSPLILIVVGLVRIAVATD